MCRSPELQARSTSPVHAAHAPASTSLPDGASSSLSLPVSLSLCCSSSSSSSEAGAASA